MSNVLWVAEDGDPNSDAVSAEALSEEPGAMPGEEFAPLDDSEAASFLDPV